MVVTFGGVMFGVEVVPTTGRTLQAFAYQLKFPAPPDTEKAIEAGMPFAQYVSGVADAEVGATGAGFIVTVCVAVLGPLQPVAVAVIVVVGPVHPAT